MENLTKKQKIIFVLIIIFCLGIICYYVYGSNNYEEFIDDNEILLDHNDKKDESEREEKIIVHIMGAVKNEGIVELEQNSRISDAIDLAGGITPDANMKEINLAYMLEDGMKVIIPSVNDIIEENATDDNFITKDNGQVEVSGSNDLKNTYNNKLININKANQAELEQLPGIGSTTANKIINYRDENGKFSSIEDIKNVNGIGDSKYEKIKDLICVK